MGGVIMRQDMTNCQVNQFLNKKIFIKGLVPNAVQKRGVWDFSQTLSENGIFLLLVI